MGICFSGEDVLHNDHRRVSFREDNISFPKQGSCAYNTNYIDQLRKSHITSTSDFNRRRSCSRKELPFPLRVNYSEISHHNGDSTSQQVSVGGSANERNTYKLVDLLDRSTRLVTTKRSPTRLSSLSMKFSRKRTGIESIHDCREDDAINSKLESPRSKCIGLIVSHLVESVSPLIRNIRRSSSRSAIAEEISKIEAPIGSCSHSQAMFEKSKEDHYARALPPMRNIDQYYNISSKITRPPPLSKQYSIEAASDRSNHNGVLAGVLINDTRSDCIGMVDEAALKFNRLSSCEKREFESWALGLCSLSMDSEKAFGSPFSVESKNLCEKRREDLKTLSRDDLSDSSSDLFDIDFRKEYERVAGVAFAAD